MNTKPSQGSFTQYNLIQCNVLSVSDSYTHAHVPALYLTYQLKYANPQPAKIRLWWISIDNNAHLKPLHPHSQLPWGIIFIIPHL